MENSDPESSSTMETSNHEQNSIFLYNIKVEVEPTDESGLALPNEKANIKNLLSEPSDLIFRDTEVTTDPRTGLSVCMLCLADLLPDEVTEHMVNVHKFRKIFLKCWGCGQLFQERDHLTAHKQVCQPVVPVKKKKTLKQLLKEATEKYDGSVCPICLVGINEPLDVHVEREHKKPDLIKPKRKPELPSECDVCNKVFKARASLLQHKKLVHESKRDSVECPECTKKFSSHKLLANHMRNVHPTDGRIHTCEECGKGYKSHQSLYQHIKHVHHGVKVKRRNDKIYTCDECTKEYRSYQSWYQHVRAVHHGIRRRIK